MNFRNLIYLLLITSYRLYPLSNPLPTVLVKMQKIHFIIADIRNNL
jgi:hypothetical protein